MEDDKKKGEKILISEVNMRIVQRKRVRGVLTSFGVILIPKLDLV
jgi:hypothetical protein